MKPLITIGIPTRNRQKFLKRLLEQLETELKGHESEVEVLVSDNGSEDDTSGMCREMQKRLPLRYSRHAQNVGFDRNVTTLIEKAEGEYLWMFGDDDLFTQGAIGRMIDALKKQKEPLGCVLANYVSLEGKTMPAFGTGTELEIHDPKQLNQRLMDAIGFSLGIGVTIYRTEIAKRTVKEKVRLQEDGSLKLKLPSGERVAFYLYIQMYYTVECILNSPSFALYPMPCMRVLCDGGGSMFSGEKGLNLLLSSNLRLVEDLSEYFPHLYRDSAILGSTPYLIMRFFIYIDPAFDREAHARWYVLTDRYIAVSRKSGNRWWRLFWLMRHFHSSFPFGGRIFWTVYVVFNRLRGKKTFSEFYRRNEADDTGKKRALTTA